MSSQRARNVSPKEEMRRLNYDDITNEDTSFYDYAARLQTGGLDSHIDMTLQEMAVGNSEPEKKTMCESAKFRRIKSLTLTACFLMGCSVYLGFAVYLNPSESVFVCIVGALIFMFSVNALASGRFFSCIQRYATKVKKCVKLKNSRRVFVRRLITVAAIIGILVFLVLDIWDEWHKWTPVGGLAFFVIISVIFSTNFRKINWVTVIWGVLLQFALGLLILRWEPGFRACQWFGDQVTAFLAHTDRGSSFVFGEKYLDHPVAFKILPVVVFFSAVVSVLYYVGAMQAVIRGIACVLQWSLNTTPIESFATAAHIFIGQVESSVALRPFWTRLTESEIHAVMTGGFATVAGTVIAAYVEFGVRAEHVISASFMSAPAALAIAKISVPETQISNIKTQNEIKLPSGQETNLIEALSVGATMAIKLIAYVVVNLIAFISILGFLDDILGYLGSKVNFPELSFQLVCSYVFMPLAAMIGVDWADTRLVGALIGKKVVINEFLAYIDLGTMIKGRTLSDRSAILATYCLCGFGSIPALGINLGALSSAAPDRRSDFARLILRAMINGNIACFMTACVAGLLYQSSADPGINGGYFNSTNSSVANTNSTTVFNTEDFIMSTTSIG